MKFNLLQFYGIVVIITVSLFFSIYILEYFTGNGDGIWHDFDVLRVAFKVILFEYFVFLLFYGVKKCKPWFSNALLSLFTIAITFVLIEFAIGMLIKINASKAHIIPKFPSFERPDHTQCVVFDDTLGYKAKPNWHLNWQPSKESKSLYFSTDTLSRRIIPTNENSKNVRDKYALFLGCSYTYGDGVSDNETMPYFFEQKAQHHLAQNYGFMGYSPLHSLALFQFRSLRKEIKEQQGFAVYTYINDQIDRVIPASRWIELMKGRFPNLIRQSMTTDGIFLKKHHVLYDFVLWASNTNTAQYFRIGYPKIHNDSHYQLVVDILKKTKEEYQHQFKNDNFYVIIFPGNPLEPSMKTMFDHSGIKYFDYSKLVDLEKNYLPFDSAHPKGEVYKLVMDKFYSDLEKEKIVN
ncbi:MAG: hypothetical protein H7339_07390 [Arcicella sp.]|nr:hypothetical protein [Arcicella sp.]